MAIPSQSASPGPLSFREKEIIRLLTQGRRNKQIAWDLRLSEATVKNYLHGIFLKLGVENRIEVALWGLKNLAWNDEGTPPAATPPHTEG